MLKGIRKLFYPLPLSEKWLHQNATVHGRSDFVAEAKSTGATPMFHVTDLERAQSIVDRGEIYGVDVVSSAHFHRTPEAASHQADASGFVLGFSWSGQVIAIDLPTNLTSHNDRRPNILFDAPISEFDRRTWELRLYPGTVGLALSYVEVAGNGYLLRKPIELRVIGRGW